MAAAGCTEPAAPEATSTTASAITTDDTDFAQECTGILGYADDAAFAELDSYLPSNVASAIVARRALRPFDDIADLSSVSGVGEARLEQIANRANALDWTDVGCYGIVDELAVSFDDEAAILAFVNTAASTAIHNACREDPDPTSAAIIAGRPYTTLPQISAVRGVGPATFRSLRDAAIAGPFDQLAATVTAAGRDVTFSTNFDWLSVLFQQPGRPTSISCWGVAPGFVAEVDGIVRPELADGNEVMANVTGTLGYANRSGAPIDGTAGLADLARNVAGQTFFGCYLRYAPDPWSGVDRAFYVNQTTGYRVFTEERWSE
ncbi:MAG TPA: hypothetical protein VH165_23110 [Kofleriaceae bacterium]|nr:hypothetical protein [Kofleriaceae bacterium]